MTTRRVFLKAGGMALFSCGVGPGFLDRLALATPSGRPKVLVSIFLRGAMDGLMAVPPLTLENDLKRLRPRLAMSAARSSETPVIDLDVGFGLHPAFTPLARYWAEGRLGIVHAVGSPNPTRSHFAAQDLMENGTPWRRGTESGWLNRVAEHLPGSSPWTAVSITRDLPRSLYGVEPAMAIADLGQLKLDLGAKQPHDLRAREQLQLLYDRGAGSTLGERGREMFEAMKVLAPRELREYQRRRGARYPSSKLGQSLLQIAYLIKAGVGLRIACADSAGWDTHVAQGTGKGPFAQQATDLATSIAAFWDDIEQYQDDVVVLTMTEFGRTVEENGSGGTDHGHGSCLFVLGNAVDGGKVYGELATLAPEGLFEERDLPVTTDFRAVFSEVAGRHFGIHDDTTVFPGWTGGRLPLLW